MKLTDLAPTLFLSSVLFAQEPAPSFQLFEDLKLVEQIDRELKEKLPIVYNYNTMVGYLNTPSARMNKMGTLVIGGGRISPYNNYGINFQFFDRLELAANYRVYTDLKGTGFASFFPGENEERIATLKFGLLTPNDGIGFLPSLAVGADDFMSTGIPTTQYIVATKEFLEANLEISLGWGRKGMKGPFGGLAWTPLRKMPLPFLKDLTFLLEYDAHSYPQNGGVESSSHNIKGRVNAGVTFIGWDTLQLSCSNSKGNQIAASASIRYPLGTSKGLFKKTDPELYTTPVDFEPVGMLRSEKEFAHELAHALKKQGLDLFEVFLISNSNQRELWIKVINTRYREQDVVRTRLAQLLSRLLPSNIDAVTVLIEADAIPCFSYRFRKEELTRFYDETISLYELEIASPMQEATPTPDENEAALLFHRKKAAWSFLLRPRILTFFGPSNGKFKYNFGLIASPEGYLFDEIFYKMQLRQTIVSSMQDLPDYDPINPSQLPNVRTDSIRYYQSNITALEMAYFQKGFNHKKGLYSRVAAGYFEPAYGGVAAELLYFPVVQNWALGFEAATVWKRRYTGLGFTGKIREYKGPVAHFIPFTGFQCFCDFYYIFKPLMLDLKLTAGQFLARDRGLRTEVGKTYPNGLRVALWYTVTNGHDHVNGRTYYDKGFMFSLPLDFFLKKTNRNFMGYAMSAWLRDVGAQAETGKKLWNTLYEERY